jgi:hypothetical protein
MDERISDTATEVQEGLVARWRKHIQDQPASGLTQKAYCSDQGLSIQAFRHWKYQTPPRIADTPSVPSATLPPSPIS